MKAVPEVVVPAQQELQKSLRAAGRAVAADHDKQLGLILNPPRRLLQALEVRASVEPREEVRSLRVHQRRVRARNGPLL